MKNKAKYKTEWDLSYIYNDNVEAQVKKDNAVVESSYKIFASKYQKNKSYLKNSDVLKRALEEYEKLLYSVHSSRPYMYFAYRKNLDSQDNEAVAELAKLTDFHAKLANQIKFFPLEIGKIPKRTQKKFLKDNELLPFKYLLQKIFENAKYRLSENEEKIMTLKKTPAQGMWISGFSRLLNKQMVSFKGKNMPVSKATGLMSSLNTKERRILHDNIMVIYESIADFAESEINAIVTDKKINDKLRGYNRPYEATVLEYENDLKTIENLLAAINNNMHIAHRFYKLKAKMLGQKKLFYADRNAKLGQVKTKIPLESAIKQTIKSFNSADSFFGNFVKEMFEKGLVDAYPKKGKVGGAFCSSAFRLPTYVLLNHVSDFKSLTTLAHEMGHALHTEFSKKQRPFYEDYTIATAEVASTFFENLVFENALEKVSREEKIILLHDKISDDISTVFRQIACFNFENELHQSIRKEGFLPKEKIAELMNKHMQKYLGPVFDLKPRDGYFFVHWSHIRRFFYVYSYAFGNLISTTLYQRYKKDKSKIKDVIKFLSAGSSDSPENIFRSIGINPDKKFFEKGLEKIKEDIKKLEQLWRSTAHS
ncbi:MAG: M3 family oligoendopeptidase [Patescibacteria group bacterium]